MVCLSLENGQPLWEQPLQVDQGEVALYMAQSENKVVLVASGGGAYHTYAYRADTGQLTWKRDVKWPQDHHGGHMARPAIVKDVVYVRPAALSLSKGDLLNISMPGGVAVSTLPVSRHSFSAPEMSLCGIRRKGKPPAGNGCAPIAG